MTCTYPPLPLARNRLRQTLINPARIIAVAQRLQTDNSLCLLLKILGAKVQTPAIRDILL